jgi:pimeloyl-ACP methyl ester carboxylesterase
VHIDRGLFGAYPYAAVGDGAPVVVLAGLSPTTGVDGDTTVKGVLAPFRSMQETRRLVVLNRRSGLPRAMTMAELAAEHADAIRHAFSEPVDLAGLSTGGSIAAQLAADHPDVVRRLVLACTAARLGQEGRRMQADMAAAVRRGDNRGAAAIGLAGLVPWRPLKPVAAAIGRGLGQRLVKNQQDWDDLATTIEAEDGFDLARCATPIAAPTLLLAGARDRFYPRDLVEDTAHLIPHCELMLIEGRGHISVARDRRFAHAIAGFLSA